MQCNTIQYLFLPCEDVFVEVVVQLLVSDVDAQLLKRVRRKVFKPENIQDTDCVGDLVWYGMYCMVLFGEGCEINIMEMYHLVWYGLVWYGMVWYCTVGANSSPITICIQ